MPESYLWLLNHVGNTFALSTQQRKFKKLSAQWEDEVTVKKLSSSSWCVWALGHDHRVYIYVFTSDVPIRLPDTLYENQRWIPLNGFSQSHLLPTDRFPWSDETGLKDSPKESFRLPSAHWDWETDWMVDENLRGEVVGREGWQYAVDFPSAIYTPESHWRSCVRKRKWIRFRRFTSTDLWVRVSDMEVVEKSECFIDVSIGGFCLPSQPPGFLSVWAVTNNGHVFVRTNVYHNNPEGNTWQEISLGSNLGVVNICMGASNLLWAVTWDGQALVRSGINRNNIYGTQWEMVDPPDESTRFMQVAVGKNVVWALSREGKVFFRKGTYGDDIQGNVSSCLGSLWVEMVGEMSFVAVSVTDQVFAIDMNGSSVYFRTGVTSSNLTGKTWQQVSLHEDVHLSHGLTEACRCGSDHMCDLHNPKPRASSFTTSCSSCSTCAYTEDSLSDVFVSAQSPETVSAPLGKDEKVDVRKDEIWPVKIPASHNLPQALSDQIESSSPCAAKEESGAIESVQPISSDRRGDVCSDEGDLSPTQNVTASISVETSNSKDKQCNTDKEMIKLETAESVDDVCEVKMHPQQDISVSLETSGIQGKDTEGSVRNISTHEDAETPGTREPSSKPRSDEAQVHHFIEELPEVDRFLVEKEILDLKTETGTQDQNPGQNELENRNSNQNLEKKDAHSHHDSKESILDVKDSEIAVSHQTSIEETIIQRHFKKSSKSHHTKRRDTLSELDSTDAIVYKSPGGKKKKKHKEALSTEKEEASTTCKENQLESDNSLHSLPYLPNTELLHCEEPSVLSNAEEIKSASIPRPDNNSFQQPDKDDSSNAGEIESRRNDEACEMNLPVNDLPSPDSKVVSPLNQNDDSRSSDIPGLSLSSSKDAELTAETNERKFSVDSTDSSVSDGIIDFVSFVDDEEGGGESNRYDKVDYSTSTGYDNLKVAFLPKGNKDSERSGHVSQSIPEETDLLSKEGAVASHVVQEDDKANVNDNFDAYDSSTSGTYTPEFTQVIPLRPARKVFRYRQSPSLGITSVTDTPPLSQTFADTVYTWRCLDVHALHIDDPNSVPWLRVRLKEEKPTQPKISVSLRNDIMCKLRERNKREITQFMNYETAVKKATWVKKVKMQIYVKHRGGQWMPCDVEMEQSKIDLANCFMTLQYTVKRHHKVQQVNLKTVRCVCSSSNPDMRTAFNIYISSDIPNPVMLQASSEAEAMEWMNLLCSANADLSNLNQAIPPSAVWSCTRLGDILVSPSNCSDSPVENFFWGQHGGHMAMAETGVCGVTWGIGFDRMPYVYNGGYGGAYCTDIGGMSHKLQDVTDFDRIHVYENQMWFPVAGWCTKGMLSNNFHWITQTGKSVASKDGVLLPSSKWQWVSEWTIDLSTPGGVNSEGWQFSTHQDRDFHPTQTIRDCYRRRRWVRKCRLNTQGPWMPAGSLCLLDVPIQIDPMTASSKNLVVWAVATNGNVLCRFGVTKDNPLGQSWEHIPTDLDKPFVSISIGGGWRVWGIASDGSTWFRSGVTQYNPYGKCWLQVVERPSGNGILKQLSAGLTAVWAVDSEDNLWRRRNITKTFPEGTDWEFVASRVTRVSVGPEDQVWIIADTKFNHSNHKAGVVYRRLGISEDKPEGTSWERVIGDGWSHVCIRGLWDN